MEEKELPSVSKQLASLTKTAFDVIKNYTQNGELIAPNHVKDARLQICSTCQWYDEASNRCLDCGCYLSNKVRFSASSCPLGFW